MTVTPGARAYLRRKKLTLKAKSNKRGLMQVSKKVRNMILIGILAALVAAVGIAGILEANAERERQRLQEAYTSAIDLIAAEDYAGALSVLEPLAEDNYEETAQLICLCNAALSLEKGYYSSAYFEAKDLTVSSLPSELTAQAAVVIAEIVSEYYDYCARVDQEKAAAYAEKVRTGVPYVGMWESQISKTSLGAPSSKVRHNTAMIDGQSYTANLYDFYEDGVRIFSVRCVQSKVIQVWDMRDKLTQDIGNAANGSSGSTANQNHDDGETEDDPFDAASYSHPDDFYYDHHDDFYDYEDAEDYWETHH